MKLALALAVLTLAAPALGQTESGAALPIIQTAADRAPAPGALVFAYFKEPGNQGIFLALSRDGYTFTPLNDGQPWLKPEQPGEIMRDIFITRDPSGSGFRAVWTWNWRGTSFGTASSPDLMTWSKQTEVPIMKDTPVRNVWAPETYWDEQAKDWLLIWSSAPSTDESGNRIWSSHTKDFADFSNPAVFYDPGFVVIDATMFHRHFEGKSDWVFMLKDQTQEPLRYQERWTSGPTVQGPWAPLSGPIDESWSEGPSVIQVSDRWIVYYDHYRAPRARYEGVETTDWIHWTSVNDKMHFPEYCKHGSFFRVSEVEAERLLARHDGSLASP